MGSNEPRSSSLRCIPYPRAIAARSSLPGGRTAMRASLDESASSDSRSAPSGRSIRHDEGMANVTELRVALTVEDFDRAVAFYRDALGLELFDSAQAESVDAIEAGRRVSGTVRFALQVEDSVAVAERLVAAGAERVAEPVIAPWGDVNARVK